MTDPTPITPPPELVQQWYRDAEHQLAPYYVFVTRCAAQWGWDQRGTINEAQLQERADQELEACTQLLDINGCPGKWIDMLRTARRPKPLSLKEQALLQLDTLSADLVMHGRGCALSQIRLALEALPE